MFKVLYTHPHVCEPLEQTFDSLTEMLATLAPLVVLLTSNAIPSKWHSVRTTNKILAHLAQGDAGIVIGKARIKVYLTETTIPCVEMWNVLDLCTA